jgi:hypothetical protein
MNAIQLCQLACGVFFLTGLLTGLWKYLHIRKSPTASAPVYVDIAHRASLMYSFSALVLKEFVPFSPFSDWVTWLAVAAPLLFFALSIQMYIVHGFLQDTDNQLQTPHRLGNFHLPAWVLAGFMGALALAEIAGFALLFYGFLLHL